MTVLTYKYRIKDRRARKFLRGHAYAVNQVWNYCVAQQRDAEARYMAGAPKRKFASHYDLQKLCKGVGQEIGLHQQSVQNVCHSFTVARAKTRSGPRFRASFGPRRALGWIPFQQQSRQITSATVTYLGRTYRWFGSSRRPLPLNAKGGCFVEDSKGRWYVCFHVEAADDRLTGTGQVGIDLGLKTFAACSDGAKIEAPRIFRRYEQKLATAQRAGNRNRARAIHAKIRNARRDFTHKASAEIARKNDLIVVGNVNASALGQTRFAKSVFDAGWSQFRNALEYKARMHRARFVEVAENWTSQTCSSCGSVESPSRPKGIAGLGIRVWECSECGSHHDRDVNAARNILRLGLSAQPRVDESRPLVTQEAA